jgi:predicted metal-dependent phosphoesterase TrpH
MYKYDTHVHTSEVSPCGKVEAAEIVRLYKQEGYSGIVITDHYYDGFFNKSLGENWNNRLELYLKGYRNALEEGLKIGLDVLLGIELRFEGSPNDYLIYGITEKFLLDYPELYKFNPKEFKKLTDKMGLLIYQAHPYRKNCTPASPDLLHGVEVYNGHPRHDSRNDLALKFGKDNNLKSLSGSDFHQRPDLARGGILVKEKIPTIEKFVEIIKDETRFSLIKSDDPIF